MMDKVVLVGGPINGAKVTPYGPVIEALAEPSNLGNWDTVKYVRRTYFFYSAVEGAEVHEIDDGFSLSDEKLDKVWVKKVWALPEHHDKIIAAIEKLNAAYDATMQLMLKGHEERSDVVRYARGKWKIVFEEVKALMRPQ